MKKQPFHNLVKKYGKKKVIIGGLLLVVLAGVMLATGTDAPVSFNR